MLNAKFEENSQRMRSLLTHENTSMSPFSWQSLSLWVTQIAQICHGGHIIKSYLLFVCFAHYRIKAADYCNHVGNEMAFHQMRNRLQIDHRRGADLHSPRLSTTFADNIKSKLTFRAFNSMVDLSFRWVHPEIDYHEIMDQLLHA